MKIKIVKYGRTIECGKFGRGKTGKIWFGWEAEVEDQECPEEVKKRLFQMAEEREAEERRLFNDRNN